MRLDWNNLSVKFLSGGYSAWPDNVRSTHTWSGRLLGDQDLWIFHGGRCSVELQEGRRTLSGDAILWMRPGNGHRYRIEQDLSAPISMSYFHFELRDRQENLVVPDLKTIPEVIQCSRSLQWRLSAQNIIDALMSGEKKERNFSEDFVRGCGDRALVASELLKGVLMALDLCSEPEKAPLRSGGRKNAIAVEAAAVMENVPTAFGNVSDLARKFGLSRNRFCVIFQEYWKISPVEYLIRLRMERAKKLLRYSDEPIKEVARQLGYADHFFFVRQFKLKNGISPGVFRKTFLQNQL